MKPFFQQEEVDATISAFIDPDEVLATKIDIAGYIIHPKLVRDPQDIVAKLKVLNAQARQLGKRIIVFILSDFEAVYPRYSHLLLCRTSIRKSFRKENEWVMPYLWESKHEAFEGSKVYNKPIIGFCGYVGPERERLHKAFQNEPDFDLRIIKRDAFWGGDPHNPLLMKEYWDNMMESHFVLANRGAGNFSMRFYQAMSAGRIPVLINTDTLLPFEDLINWNQTIIMADSEEACVSKVKAAFNNNEIVAMQQRCYDVYHCWLSKESFFRQFVDNILVNYANPTRKWYKIWN